MIEPRVVDDIENFATEIIDKATLKAMDVVDASIEVAETNSGLSESPNNANLGKFNEPKNRSLRSSRRGNNERMKKHCSRDAEEPANCPSLDDVDQRASEEIRKIVEGLRGVQIGDSMLVKSVRRVSSLEREVKRAVAQVDGALEISEVVAEGQGDVGAQIFPHEIVAASIEEQLPSGKIEKLKPEKPKSESDLSHRVAQRVEPKIRSTCFLHRMIKELEDAEANQENISHVDVGGSSISAISQERIAAWEESEEKFIRTIEGSRDECQLKVNERCSIIEETFSINPLNEASVVAETVESKPPTPPPLVNAAICAGTKSTLAGDGRSRKKKSFGEKLRRFFRSAFKRDS